jgi:hypothetical protein
MSAPILMHDPRPSGHMISRRDESSGWRRKRGQEYEDEPFMVRCRNMLSDSTQLPGWLTTRLGRSLDLYLDRRAMREVGSNSQNVCASYAVTSEGRSPSVASQGRAHPVLTDCLSHLPVKHHTSIA